MLHPKLSHFKLLIGFCLVILLNSCGKPPFFEKYVDIPKYEWTYENTAAYELSIDDTIAKYDIYIALRHNINYPYSNLYVKLYTQYPNSTDFQEQMVELPLADKEGRWHGDITGDVVRQVVSVQQNASLPNNGLYQFKIGQHMRKNPLEDIMAVGLLVEKRENQ